MSEHSADASGTDAAPTSASRTPSAPLPRSAPPPREVTESAVVRGIATAQRYIGPAALVVAFLAVLEVILRTGQPESTFSLLLWWVPMMAAAIVLAARPRRVTATIVLAVGIVTGAGWVAATLQILSGIDSPGLFLVEAIPFALLFIGAISPTPSSGIVWLALGFAGGSVALGLGHGVAGMPVQFSLDRVSDAFIIGGAYLVIAIGSRRARRRLLRLPEAARESRDRANARQRERAAAALVHDTALASLTMIERSTDELDPRLRANIRHDLTALAGSRASSGGLLVTSMAEEGTLAGRVMDVVESFRWRGLRVDVAGLETIPAEVEPAAAQSDALMLALAAALDNVLLHAGTDRADVTVGRTESSVTAMVVDAGDGFDEARIPSDRMGLRESIRARLESAGGEARVWSSDHGTTVLLSVPAAGSDR